MKTLTLVERVAVAVLAIILSVCGQALAVKSRVDLAQDNMEQQGFAVATAKRDDGTIDVTITRDLSKARSFDAASGLEVVRSATLVVAGPAGTIVQYDLEPQAAAGSVSYRFALAPEYLAHSRITVAEIDDYKNRGDRPHLIGGGTFFEMKLADVVKP
jgi:hypothetical protein